MSPAAAVRKPAFAVSFGRGSADDWARAVAEVSVESGLAPAVDAAAVVLASRSDAPRVALEDAGSVALGFDDRPARVFTGSVRGVERTVKGKARVLASDAGALLAAFRVDQSYERQSPGEIVRDLASKAGVETAAVDDGPTLPYYVVDGRRSAWEHVARLAVLAGFAAWCDADGKVRFGPLAAGAPVRTFAYGEDVLELDALEAPPTAGRVTVVGEGAAGSKGTDAWSWHVKDSAPVKASAGSGDPAVVVQVGAVRSADAARAAAESLAERARLGRVTARLLVPGAPGAGAGTTVAVEGAPEHALNGSWLVRGARHRLVKSRGYTTLLLLGKAAR